MKILKKHKIRITPQRVEVYELLLKGGNHMTAEQIYEKIKKKLPAVSLATIYTTLELLQKKNLIKEIRITFDKSCFEAHTEPHHHFLCKKCSAIYNIDIRPCPALEKRQVDSHSIEEFHGYFYGICEKCRIGYKDG
ncbi:MAG: transcriptional repressor [Candidatus Omnitrophota bacterium]|nr:MAG: transcriptional repressor [Candidatus Omnitrophota bacterium]